MLLQIYLCYSRPPVTPTSSAAGTRYTLYRDFFLSPPLFRFNSSSICDIYTATTHSMTRVNINLPGKDRIQSGRTWCKEARAVEYVDEKCCKGMFCVAFLALSHWPSYILPRHTAANFNSPTNYPVGDLWILSFAVLGREIPGIYIRTRMDKKWHWALIISASPGQFSFPISLCISWLLLGFVCHFRVVNLNTSKRYVDHWIGYQCCGFNEASL